MPPTRQVVVNRTFGHYADVAAEFQGIEDVTKPSCAELYLNECKALGIKANSALLEQLPKVKGLYCMDGINCAVNFIGDKGVRALFPLIKENLKISRLIFRDNGLTNPTVRDLARLLETHPGVHTIDLSSNNTLSIDAGMALLTLLKRNPRVCRLGLQHTAISKELQRKLSTLAATNLKQNPSAGKAEQQQQRLPRAQFMLIKDIFDKLDIDKDGLVGFAEFRQTFLAQSVDMSPPEKVMLQGLFSAMDVDRSGRIGFIEFLRSAFPQLSAEEIQYHIALYSTIELVEVASDDPVDYLTPEELEEIRAMFYMYDSDGNNFITIQELKNRLARSWLVADVDEVFNQCDSNHDNLLDIDEFTRLMALSYHPLPVKPRQPAKGAGRAVQH